MKENKNLAIIGASYLQLPLILKAKEMGYTTHVFAWAANDVGEKEADYFYPISIIEKEQILEKCREIVICGICSIASDIAVVTVNYVAENLGLVGNSIASTGKCTNKHLMRKAFEANNDPSPKSILVDENVDLDCLNLTYPVIVKPTDRSGSRGIYKLNTFEGLQEAVKHAMNEGFEKKALIEEYAEGTEYSVEHISYEGKHYFLALTLKYTTGAPNFIETGHLQPAPVDDNIVTLVDKVVSHALDTLDIKYGASHAEIKIADDGTIKIIEIGARMGGDCIGSDLVNYSTGIDFVKAVIDVSCGEKPDLTPKHSPQPAKVVFMFDEEDVRMFNDIKNNYPEKILKIVNEDYSMIGKTTDSSNRAGCYIIKAD